jgi:hypothetical protein
MNLVGNFMEREIRVVNKIISMAILFPIVNPLIFWYWRNHLGTIC